MAGKSGEHTVRPRPPEHAHSVADVTPRGSMLRSTKVERPAIQMAVGSRSWRETQGNSETSLSLSVQLDSAAGESIDLGLVGSS